MGSHDQEAVAHPEAIPVIVRDLRAKSVRYQVAHAVAEHVEIIR